MKNGLCGLLMVISVTGYSQQLKRFYFDDKDNDVDSAVSVYVKVGKTNYMNYWIDTVKTYYTSSRHLRSVEVHNSKGQRHGTQKYYFDNGVLKKEQLYVDAKLVGVTSGYYQNSKPQYRMKFPNPYGFESDEHMMVDYWDSLGNQLVKNGNGKCRCYVSIMSNAHRQEGSLVDTLREGAWLTYKNDTLVFQENYDHGKLTSGTRYYSNTKESVTYTENFKMPQPVDGLENLYQWIARNVKYPADARRLGIDGTVYVGFVVASTGELKEIKTVRGVSTSMDAESERVMSLIQPWSPGLFKGKPTAVRYMLPIKFKLEEIDEEKPEGKKKKGRRRY